MKSKIILFLIIILFSSTAAQLDRSVRPQPGPAPEIKLGDYETFELENGLKVFVIENNKLPKVNFSLLTVRDPIMEGDSKGYISFSGDLLRRGTKTRSKEEIDEQVDFIGASLNTGGTSISGSSLKKHFNKLMELFSDVLLNSEFKQEELDKIKKQTLSNLATQKDDPSSISSNLRRAIIYGQDHPYGENVTEETVNNITLEKCQQYYENFFRPNISLLAFVGDITVDEAKEYAEKYLSKWEAKEIPSFSYDQPKIPLVRKVSLVDRPTSVQSVINIAYPVDLKRSSEDVIKVSVMNAILGGTFSSRLNQNLREDKGYTYGSSSFIGPDRFVGRFTASTTVRNSVTDSAVAEIFSEMKKLRNEKVAEEELTRVKNFINGSFARSLESPATIARFALNIEINDLPSDYYKNYLKNLSSVTSEDVQNMAKKYLKPNNSHVLIVGQAEEIATKLKRFSTSGKIQYYDNYGVEYDPSIKKVEEGVSAEGIIEDYIKAIGGREKLEKIKDKTMKLKGAAQGMDLNLTISQKIPNKLFQELDFSVGKQTTIFDGTVGKIEGMGQVQKLEGEKAEQLAYQSTMNAFLDYAANNISMNLDGIENIKGKDAYKITLTSKNDRKYIHYYDVTTAYKLREITTIDTPQGSFTQIIDLDEYKEVEGIMNAFKLTQKMGPREVELNVESIQYNTGLDDSMFEVE